MHMLPGDVDVGNMARFHVSTNYSKTMHRMAGPPMYSSLSLHEKKKNMGAERSPFGL